MEQNVEEITAALKNIKEVGSFCAQRMLPVNKLQIAIKPLGILNFPLSSQVVKELIKVAKPAKFGWRDQTLLDLNVRNTWEISKDQITIDTTAWEQELQFVVELLKEDLGLPKAVNLQPNLHNLIIYEPGQFFNYHQDTEKLDDMVATLIIVLPSAHKGGTLIIDHKGTKKRFHSSRFPIDQLTFIAFYADCHHAVKIVKQGYRLALTYNLTMRNNNKIDLSNIQNYNETLIKSLSNYFIENAEYRSFKRYVYLLDHSYTQKSLSWDRLKNVDLLRAKALKIAADLLDLEIYMALADLQETWNCDTDYDYSVYRRLKNKYSYYKDNNEKEQDLDLIQVNELIDSSTILKYWINQDNYPLDYKDCYVSSKYIGWSKASNEFRPFQSEYEDYMGNYGNTLDRWYHRAAIILWKKQDHYPILFEMDPGNIINELFTLSKKSVNNPLESILKVAKIINIILPYWSKYLSRSHDLEIYAKIFNLALYIDDPKIAKAMLINFSMKILNSEIASLFLSLENLYGTSYCIDLLVGWSNNQEDPNVILKDFSNLVDILYTPNRPKITEWLLKYQFDQIVKYHEYSRKNCNRVEIIKSVGNRINEIINFINVCIKVNNIVIYTKMLDQIISDSELYPAIDLVNIILDLKKHSLDQEKWHYQKLFNYVLNSLENERKLGLRKKDDWSINEKISCDCHDCRTLREFLQAKDLITIKWPLGKERRQHIHRIIDGLGISVSHKTEHTGSPHKLILIKTENLYKAAKKHFSNLEKILTELLNL